MVETLPTREEKEKTSPEECLSSETWKGLLSIYGDAQKAISDFIEFMEGKEANSKFSDFCKTIKGIEKKDNSIFSKNSTEENPTGENSTGENPTVKNEQKIKDVQDFFEKLGNALRDVIGKIKKGENEGIDDFIGKMFEVSHSFYEINVGIINKSNYLRSSLLKYDYSDPASIPNDIELEGDVNELKNLMKVKDYIKQIGINIYKPLLELVCKEFEMLLRDSGNNEPIPEEEYNKLKQELYIMEYLNIESYEDFREIIKGNLLRDRREIFSNVEQKMKGTNDYLHMENFGKLYIDNYTKFINEKTNNIKECLRKSSMKVREIVKKTNDFIADVIIGLPKIVGCGPIEWFKERREERELAEKAQKEEKDKNSTPEI